MNQPHRSKRWKRYQAGVYALEQEVGHEVTPHDLVRDFRSRKKESAFWDYFERDMRRGYEKHLLEQARELLQNLKVLYVIDGEPVPLREYVRLETRTDDRVHIRGAYVHGDKVVRDPFYLSQLDEKAVLTLESWKKSFALSPRVRSSFPLIDRAITMIRARTKRVAKARAKAVAMAETE